MSHFNSHAVYVCNQASFKRSLWKSLLYVRFVNSPFIAPCVTTPFRSRWKMDRDSVIDSSWPITSLGRPKIHCCYWIDRLGFHFTFFIGNQSRWIFCFTVIPFLGTRSSHVCYIPNVIKFTVITDQIGLQQNELSVELQCKISRVKTRKFCPSQYGATMVCAKFKLKLLHWGVKLQENVFPLEAAHSIWSYLK